MSPTYTYCAEAVAYNIHGLKQTQRLELCLHGCGELGPRSEDFSPGNWVPGQSRFSHHGIGSPIEVACLGTVFLAEVYLLVVRMDIQPDGFIPRNCVPI